MFLYLKYLSSEPMAVILTWNQDTFIPKSMILIAINTLFVVVLIDLHYFKENITMIVFSI